MARRRSEPLLLELDLSRGVLETPPSSPLQVQARQVPVLRAVVEALAAAARDERVVGLVAQLGPSPIGLAHSSELRDAVRRFRGSGKLTVAWTETFGEMSAANVGYHLATAFEEIWLQPTGDLCLTGVVARAVFVRGALDRLGVDPQLAQRYEYKTAADTFVRTGMSDAGREMARRLAESATETIVADVAAGRQVEPGTVREAIERAPLTADEALEARLVDRLGYRDEVYSSLRSRLGAVDLRYVDRYGRHRARRAALRRAALHRSRPVVALVHASGPILVGRGGGFPLGSPRIGSDALGATLRLAGRDPAVKAVVLRVDSPGGSYVASDAIRREVLQLRASGTPVIGSMAGVAASGGYYISMPCDTVLADAGTITGSIGVLGGKQVLRDALGRIGVNVDSEAVGAQAEMFSTQRPFSEDEWARLEAWLDRVYDDFTGKAAGDRGMPLERVQELAKGRVWTGADAVANGLVDRVGGLEDALELACRTAGLRRRDVDVKPLPHLSLRQRLQKPESSEHPAAGRAAVADHPLLPTVLGALGLPPSTGILSLPVAWQLS